LIRLMDSKIDLGMDLIIMLMIIVIIICL